MQQAQRGHSMRGMPVRAPHLSPCVCRSLPPLPNLQSLPSSLPPPTSCPSWPAPSPRRACLRGSALQHAYAGHPSSRPLMRRCRRCRPAAALSAPLQVSLPQVKAVVYWGAPEGPAAAALAVSADQASQPLAAGRWLLAPASSLAQTLPLYRLCTSVQHSRSRRSRACRASGTAR